MYFITYLKTCKNLSVKYYQNNKERLQKRAREKYLNLSKETLHEKQYFHKSTQRKYHIFLIFHI